MKIIEFIGLPGSGKSTTLNKIKLYSHNYKKNSYTYKNFLFNFYEKKNDKKIIFFIIKKLNTSIFLEHRNKDYIKNKFKNFYINILIQIILLTFKNSKEYLFYKTYKRILNFSAHSSQRVKRMEVYFLLKVLSFKLSKKLNSKKYCILDDEGFHQNLIIKYKNFKVNKKKIFQEIIRYINLSPKPNLLVVVSSKNEEIIKRTNLRAIGYKYYEDDLLNKLENWNQVKTFLIDSINKKNVKLVRFNNYNNFDKSEIQKLLNKLDNSY
jgi:hypothetical protein|tara:strand:+ start:5674 stop:6471 length:798 start_codon:yes stop_codon:yes gene_type:complete